jgi:hypothetical protein
MNWEVIFLLTLLLGDSYFQTADLEKWNTVSLVCGRLIQVRQIPMKGASNSFTEKEKPVKDANVRLYRRDKDIPCCSAESLAAEAVSGKDGSFDFKKITPGTYWLVERVAGTDYKLAITYKPDKENGTKCGQLTYELKKGEIQLTKMVYVD